MKRLLVVFILGCVILSLASAAPKRNKDKRNKGDRQGRKEQDPDTETEPQPTGGTPSEQGTEVEEDADPKCSPWVWSECQPIEGECGKGIKVGIRGGEECKKTEKEKPCGVRCGGGKRKGKQQQSPQQDGTEPESESQSATDVSQMEEKDMSEQQDMTTQLVCSPWKWTPCEPVEGDCGKGFKIGTRGGPGCGSDTLRHKGCMKPCPDAGEKKGKKQKQRPAQEQRGEDPDEEDSDPRCSPWSFGDCEPLQGNCGKGERIGLRTGLKCKKTQKEKDCRVPCGGGGGGGGGNGGGKRKNGKQKQRDQPMDEPRPYDEDEEEEVEVKGENGKRVCKYRRGSWSECDEASNTQTRTMMLKKGDVDTCPEERYITKPCDRVQRKVERKLDCRYGAGDWGLCNITSGMRMRVDILEDEGMEIEGCRTQRIVYKKCNLACDYEYTEWTTCDSMNQERSTEGTLIRTEDTPPDCEPTVIKTKPCFGRNGREKCFFGPWSEYTPCINGFKYRMRELVAGGRKCELQASHAAKCKEKEMKE